MEIQGLQSGNGIASNPVANGEITKDTFLQLLSTQLQHQDPLEPASDVEFIQQMATFAMLEQQQKTNANLNVTNLYENSINNSNALNIVGKEVKIQDSIMTHTEGQSHTVYFESDSLAAKVNIRITDEKGKEIYSQTQIGSEDGEQEFHWHGTNNDGEPVADGDYQISVTLEDGEGNTFPTPVFQNQKVRGISYENGTIMVLVGDKRIPIENVVEVYQAGQATTGDAADGGLQFKQGTPSEDPMVFSGPASFLNTNPNPYHPFRVIAGGK